MIKKLLTLLAIGVVTASCSWAPGEKKENRSKKKPNIVFILADDIGYRDLSCYGQKHYNTPNLDLLAVKGVRFTQAYSSAPSCSPTRAGLLTGLHAGHASIRMNGSARGQEPLHDEEITIAEVLKTAGYKTCLAGKSALGEPGSEGVPYKQGFDLSFGIYSQMGAHTYFPSHMWLNEKKIIYPQNEGFDMAKRYLMSKNPPKNYNTYDENGDIYIEELKDPKDWIYSVNEIENVAMKFIRDNKDNPFFLYYPTQLPHAWPMVDNIGEMRNLDVPQPKQEWAAMVVRLDKSVGKLIDELKKQGIYDNTIIFFASDNGYTSNDEYFQTRGPFSGKKFSVEEGGCRIPFFVSWEGAIEPHVVSHPVWLPDFFPTAANLAGATFDHKIDGVDLWPILGGDPKDFIPHKYLYFNYNREQSVRLGAWKGYRKSPDQPLRLCLVEEDTREEHDLSAYYPDVVMQIEEIMDTAYTYHPWYWLPNETEKDYQKKVKTAQESGQVFEFDFPNGVSLSEVRKRDNQ